MPIGRPDKLRDSNAHCECAVSHPYLCGFPNPLTYARVAANRSCNWHHPTQHDRVIISDLPIMPKPATSRWRSASCPYVELDIRAQSCPCRGARADSQFEDALARVSNIFDSSLD